MAYQPAGNVTTTSTIGHLATVYYNKRAEDQLREVFLFWKLVDSERTRTLPQNSGKTIQFFRYENLGANTTPTTEGTVGTSLQLSSAPFTASVSQYADFISFSDLLEQTAIDPIVAEGADQLGYRAGLTVDNLNKAEVDGSAGSFDLPLLGDFYSSGDAANARHQMQGLKIRPLREGLYEALIHPYVSYDLIRDPQAGNFLDLTKRPGSDQNSVNFRPPADPMTPIAVVGGVRFWESTNVTKTSGSPNTWRVYYSGRGGLAAIDLAGRGPQRSMSQERDRFRVNVFRPGLTDSNPEGKIAAFASYNFVYVAKLLDTTNYRLRKTDAPSSIVA